MSRWIASGHYVAKSLASRPYNKALDGDVMRLQLVDPTPDGGGVMTPFSSGRPIRPDNVPTRAQRKGGSLKTFPHLEFDQFASLPFVSERVRDMIEALEPGVHQFFPVEVRIGRDHVARRHILIVCNRLDSLHPTLTFPRNSAASIPASPASPERSSTGPTRLPAITCGTRNSRRACLPRMNWWAGCLSQRPAVCS